MEPFAPEEITIFDAAYEGNTEMVQYYLDNGVSYVNAKGIAVDYQRYYITHNGYGEQFWHYYYESYYGERIEDNVEYDGINVFSKMSLSGKPRYREGFTIMDYAAMMYHFDTVYTLIGYGGELSESFLKQMPAARNFLNFVTTKYITDQNKEAEERRKQQEEQRIKWEEERRRLLREQEEEQRRMRQEQEEQRKRLEEIETSRKNRKQELFGQDYFTLSRKEQRKRREEVMEAEESKYELNNLNRIKKRKLQKEKKEFEGIINTFDENIKENESNQEIVKALEEEKKKAITTRLDVLTNQINENTLEIRNLEDLLENIDEEEDTSIFASAFRKMEEDQIMLLQNTIQSLQEEKDNLQKEVEVEEKSIKEEVEVEENSVDEEDDADQ